MTDSNNPSHTREQDREKIEHIIDNYRPIDDNFFRELMSDNKPLAELITRLITNKEVKITDLKIEHELYPLGDNRGIRLDAYGITDDGKKINIEMQRKTENNNENTLKRVRYYSSMLDITSLQKKDKFSQLPITYVIFIMGKDIFGKNQPVYTIRKSIQYNNTNNDTTSIPYDDGSHIIYANCAYDNINDTSELASLLKDFTRSKADDMKTSLLAKRTKDLKETEKGRETMCEAVEKYAKEYAKEHAEEYAKEYAKKYAKDEKILLLAEMIEKGRLVIQDAVSSLGISPEEFEKRVKELRSDD